MHSDVTAFSLTEATSLAEVLALLAESPGSVVPIAGGTELMVAFNAGRLSGHSFVSIRHLSELRFVRVDTDVIHIGAGTTFTDIRRNNPIAQALPLLAQAASWTGSIANQNRGTLGGNICNASPAADTPPALLAYDASVNVISTRGMRTLPYRDFHLGYKRTTLRPDELLHSVSINRHFEHWHQYIRKVGTRNAQAISKTALAGVALVRDHQVQEIRLGAASLADRPLRLMAAEEALRGCSLEPEQLEAVVRRARAALAAEVKPIDDIRSTARYRMSVAANLLEEFIRQLAS